MFDAWKKRGSYSAGDGVQQFVVQGLDAGLGKYPADIVLRLALGKLLFCFLAETVIKLFFFRDRS